MYWAPAKPSKTSMVNTSKPHISTAANGLTSGERPELIAPALSSEPRKAEDITPHNSVRDSAIQEDPPDFPIPRLKTLRE
jgi:hypothetical protein